MSVQGKEFAEAMSEPFVAALRDIDRPLIEGGQPTVVAMAHCQILVRDALNEVDWSSTGLKPVDLGEASGELEPYDYANRLMAYAFSDAYDLIQLCERRAEAYPLPDHCLIGRALLNSGRSLLKVSFVDDAIKSQLIEGIKTVEQGVPIEILSNVPDGIDDPIVFIDDTKSPRFTWRPSIEEWLTGSISPETGCPANRNFIEVDGTKVSIVSFFWDKLVRSMFPLS